MNKMYGLVRVSSASQKAHLSKQGKKMVAFGVREENLLKIVSSARPRQKREPPQGPANVVNSTGLTSCQRQISLLMESIPPGGELVVATASRLSRDYFFAVNVINKFYKRGCSIVIVSWRHNKNPKNPIPLNLEDLQTLYSDILNAQVAADNISRGSQRGISLAQARGTRWGGSCRKLSEQVLLCLKKELETTIFRRGFTFQEMQKKYQISRASLYRYRQLFKLMN